MQQQDMTLPTYTECPTTITAGRETVVKGHSDGEVATDRAGQPVHPVCVTIIHPYEARPQIKVLREPTGLNPDEVVVEGAVAKEDATDAVRGFEVRAKALAPAFRAACPTSAFRRAA